MTDFSTARLAKLYLGLTSICQHFHAGRCSYVKLAHVKTFENSIPPYVPYCVSCTGVLKNSTGCTFESVKLNFLFKRSTMQNLQMLP